MFSLVFLFLTWFAYQPTAVVSQGLKMGKADLIFKFAELCETNNKDAWNTSIQIKKISRKATNVTFLTYAKTPLGNDFDIHIDIAVKGNGGWKPNFYNTVIKDACKTSKAKKVYFARVAKDSNVPPQCPLPAGLIAFRNYTIDMDDLPIPKTLLPFASFRIDCSLRKGKKAAYCVRTYLDVVPAKH